MKFLSVGIDVPDVAHPVYSTDNTARLQHDPYPVISNAKRNVELRNLRSENRCKELPRIHIALFDQERTSLPKHYEALVTGTRARDVFITLQKRLSPEEKPCSGKKVFEEEGSRLKDERDPIYRERGSP
ncbi:hypothetical protein ALC60_01539 [Trachymyrmex zeteki]|uniref:Uncharacterized protein n=1 Tax=Mycetomoellerius zeteki TaxID=64791 RepID=A0A151XGM2_9HYME|nr:hypothetical protein ALC60_01539 [Trachymyrmex zeteki]